MKFLKSLGLASLVITVLVTVVSGIIAALVWLTEHFGVMVLPVILGLFLTGMLTVAIYEDMPE